MLFLGAVTLCFLGFGDTLVGWFQDDPEVRAVGSKALRIIGYGYVVYAWGMVMMQAFNGAGDTTTPTWVNLICFWMIQVPLAWTLAHELELGPQGVFWSVTSAETLLAGILIVLFRRGRWKTREV